MRVNAPRIGSDYEIKSKVIISPDGRPEQHAARWSRRRRGWPRTGIKVYVIGIGDDPETGRFPAPSRSLRRCSSNLNEDSLVGWRT